MHLSTVHVIIPFNVDICESVVEQRADCSIDHSIDVASLERSRSTMECRIVGQTIGDLESCRNLKVL